MMIGGRHKQKVDFELTRARPAEAGVCVHWASGGRSYSTREVRGRANRTSESDSESDLVR